MDQRNAGKSTAPVSGEDGWHTYTADHLALLDHLGIEKTHILGGCIGGPYCLGLIQTAPNRVASAVLQQSIGLENNRDVFYGLFDEWAGEIRHASDYYEQFYECSRDEVAGFVRRNPAAHAKKEFHAGPLICTFLST